MKDTITVQDYQELVNFLVERFDSIDDRFYTIDKRFERIDQRFEAIDKRFELMDKRFDKIDAKFVETQNLIIGSSLRIDTLIDVLENKIVITDKDKKLINRYKNI